MPEWIVERGIGEARAILVDQGEILEARIELEGVIRAGSIIRARLVSIGINGRNAIAVGEGGAEYMLPRGAPGLTQGMTLAIEVTREKIPGAEPWKLPLARVTDKAPGLAPSMEWLDARELVFPAPRDEFADTGWDDLIDQARTGVVTFAGGELRISSTPAMTLIDVDGYLAPDELAVLGAAEAAIAVRRLDIGGSIGIDLPTSGSKAARREAGQAIDAMLPQPFERTAINGFGFVQVVRPRYRPSLVELAQDGVMFEMRALIRRAALEGPGAKRLVAHPALTAALRQRPDWLEALARQLGGTVGLRPDEDLPMSGGYAKTA
jgi:ribonuclease G